MIAIFKSHKIRHVIVTKNGRGNFKSLSWKIIIIFLGGIVPLKIAKSNRIVM